MSEIDVAALRAAVLQAEELERRGDRGGAIAALRQAVAISPEFAPAHSHLAVLLQDGGQTQAALVHFEKAAALRPGDARTCNNLAAALNFLGRFPEAEGAARRALAADPEHEWALYNLGRALFSQHRHEEARGVLEAAVGLHAGNALAWELLGLSCLRQARLERAREALLRAATIDPSQASAWTNLASACLHSGRHQEAVNALERAEALAPFDAAQIASSRLTALHYDGARSPEEIYAQHVAWARRYAPPPFTTPFANSRVEGRRLRIGYVSGRFKDPTLAHLLVPVLSRHDSQAIEIVCYATQPTAGAAHLARPFAAEWIDAWKLDDDALAQRMRDDRIDIAVDLAGHTPGHRLLAFARRPAPVCVTWLDYFDTTGLDTMDYLVTDAWHSPPGDAQQFTETLFRLPRLRFCYQPPADCPDVMPPPMVRRGGPPALGAFSRLAKLSPGTLEAWSLALTVVPDSRLVIKNSSLKHEEERAAFASVLRGHGIDPRRVELRGDSSHKEMLAEYNDIDIVLDSFPYNGAITAMEALWMGKPVVTIDGHTLVSRQGSALLHAVGLEELVARDTRKFAERVAELAENPTYLQELAGGMRKRLSDSDLLDGRGLAAALEGAYRHFWTRWCETQK